MAPTKRPHPNKKNHETRLVFQEGTQKRPWYSYKYNKKNKSNPTDKRPAEDPQEGTSKKSRDQEQPPEEEEEESLHTSDFDSPDTPMSQKEIPSPMETQAAQEDTAIGVGANSVGGAGGGNRAGGIRGTVKMPGGTPINANDMISTYTKDYTFRIRSGLIEYKTTSANGVDTETTTSVEMKFPYHHIPVNMLGFFLTKEEIQKIFDECTTATILEVEVDVYNHQAQLPFITGATTSTIANNNVGIYLTKIHDSLYKTWPWRIPDQGALILNRCWGTHINNLPASTTYTSVGLGVLAADTVIKDLDNRAEIIHWQKPTNIRFGTTTINLQTYFEPAVPINRYKQKRINASFNEGLFWSYKYQPVDGKVHALCVNGCNFTPANTNSEHNIQCQYSCKISESSLNQASTAATFKPFTNPSFGATSQLTPQTSHTYLWPQADYGMPFDQIPIEWNNGNNLQPTLVLGIEPLVTGDLGEQQGTLVDSQILLDIKCKIKIKETRGVNYMTRFGGSIVQPDAHRPVMREALFANNNYLYVKGNTAAKTKGPFDVFGTTPFQAQPPPLAPVLGSSLRRSKRLESTMETVNKEQNKKQKL